MRLLILTFIVTFLSTATCLSQDAENKKVNVVGQTVSYYELIDADADKIRFREVGTQIELTQFALLISQISDKRPESSNWKTLPLATNKLFIDGTSALELNSDSTASFLESTDEDSRSISQIPFINIGSDVFFDYDIINESLAPYYTKIQSYISDVMLGIPSSNDSTSISLSHMMCSNLNNFTVDNNIIITRGIQCTTFFDIEL